jgi:glycosyltransferase involved in cell wall biosynthesis
MIGRVWIIMPAYNAQDTIEGVFARIPEDVRGRISRYVVVDDGSTDDTRRVLTGLTRRFDTLTILAHEKNRGYGAAEKTLLTYALDHGCEAAVLLHADGQYSPEKIPELLGPLDRDEADLVQGSRMAGGGALRGGMPLYKYIGNRVLSGIESIVFGMGLAEYHSGYLLYSRRLLEHIPFARLSDDFHFDLEMMLAAHILGFRIRQVAIPTIYADEVSHLNPVKYGFEVLGVVIRYIRGDYHRLLGVERKRFSI